MPVFGMEGQSQHRMMASPWNRQVLKPETQIRPSFNISTLSARLLTMGDVLSKWTTIRGRRAISEQPGPYAHPNLLIIACSLDEFRDGIVMEVDVRLAVGN